MSKRSNENSAFVCDWCSLAVAPAANGSYRNHCPRCLRSKHVDICPGDRAAGCGGLMTAVGLRYNPAKGFQLVHRCALCGAVRANRVVDLGDQPDELGSLMGLPLA